MTHSVKGFTIMDPMRVELISPQCECGVLPLYYEPKVFKAVNYNELFFKDSSHG